VCVPMGHVLVEGPFDPFDLFNMSLVGTHHMAEREEQTDFLVSVKNEQLKR